MINRHSRLFFDYGFALGVVLQMENDAHWHTDLENGFYTLPILCGLALKNHPKHPELVQTLEQGVDKTALSEILYHMNIHSHVTALINKYRADAHEALRAINIDNGELHLLLGMTA